MARQLHEKWLHSRQKLYRASTMHTCFINASTLFLKPQIFNVLFRLNVAGNMIATWKAAPCSCTMTTRHVSTQERRPQDTTGEIKRSNSDFRVIWLGCRACVQARIQEARPGAQLQRKRDVLTKFYYHP
jgi:hypothetical protein